MFVYVVYVLCVLFNSFPTYEETFHDDLRYQLSKRYM